MGADATPKAGVCRFALRESPKHHGYCVPPLANIWILPARRALSPCSWGALNVAEFTTGSTKVELTILNVDLLTQVQGENTG